MSHEIFVFGSNLAGKHYGGSAHVTELLNQNYRQRQMTPIYWLHVWTYLSRAYVNGLIRGLPCND